MVILFDFLPQGSPFDDDTTADLDLLLEPNNYAVIFGSGLFGADGSNSLSSNGTDTPEGEGSYFFFGADNGWANINNSDVRLFVRGSVVPEPAMLLLISHLLSLSLAEDGVEFRQENGMQINLKMESCCTFFCLYDLDIILFELAQSQATQS